MNYYITIEIWLDHRNIVAKFASRCKLCNEIWKYIHKWSTKKSLRNTEFIDGRTNEYIQQRPWRDTLHIYKIHAVADLDVSQNKSHNSSKYLNKDLIAWTVLNNKSYQCDHSSGILSFKLQLSRSVTVWYVKGFNKTFSTVSVRYVPKKNKKIWISF